MNTRLLGTPLLGMGLLMMLVGCGGNDDDTDSKPPVDPKPKDEDTYDPDPHRPAALFWNAYLAWDSVAGEVRSFTEQGQEVKPYIEVMLWSQYVDPNNPAAADICFVVVDISGATIGDWDEDEKYPLDLTVPSGANVTHNCSDWDFSSFQDPSAVFAASSWRIGLGALELDSEYLTWLNAQNFFSQRDPAHYAGGYLEFVDGWAQPRMYTLGYEVDENFALKVDNNALVRIDKFSMPGANGLIDGVYVLGTHWGWNL